MRHVPPLFCVHMLRRSPCGTSSLREGIEWQGNAMLAQWMPPTARSTTSPVSGCDTGSRSVWNGSTWGWLDARTIEPRHRFRQSLLRSSTQTFDAWHLLPSSNILVMRHFTPWNLWQHSLNTANYFMLQTFHSYLTSGRKKVPVVMIEFMDHGVSYTRCHSTFLQ